MSVGCVVQESEKVCDCGGCMYLYEGADATFKCLLRWYADLFNSIFNCCLTEL